MNVSYFCSTARLQASQWGFVQITKFQMELEEIDSRLSLYNAIQMSRFHLFTEKITMRFFLIPTLLACFLSQVAAADTVAQRTISVTGRGSASAPPDVASVNTGVITQAATAGEALKANTEIMQRIMKELKTQEIASKDIQTSNFSVSPEYRRDDRGRTQPEIVGYRVSNQLTVKVHNLPSLGGVLDALVKTGSNRINGITFGIDEPEGLLNQARNRAIKNATSKAALYASAMGVKVGPVISISEAAIATPRPQFMAARAMADSAVPIAAGEQQLTATINIVFGID